MLNAALRAFEQKARATAYNWWLSSGRASGRKTLPQHYSMSSQTNTMAPSPQQALSGQGVLRISGKYATMEGCCRKIRTGLSTVIRLGTLNVGSLTGRSMEIAEMLERRKIDICCVQETRWKSNGVRHINSDKEKFKLFWNGQNTAQNGVGIFIKEPLAQDVLEVARVNSRLMWIKLRIEKQTMTIFSAYAPQTGESEEVKNDFWTAFSDTIITIPASETILIAGDLNGHVGEKTNGFNYVHGGFGYGEWNEDGNRILEFAESHEFCLLNTYFRKRSEHLITYKSGPSATQIDFFAVKQQHRRLFKDVKVIPGESCIPQHRLLVADMVIEPSRHVAKQLPQKIKTWKLKNIVHREKFQHLVATQLNHQGQTSIDWKSYKTALINSATTVCGKTGTKRQHERETWWWNESVQNAIAEKKAAFKRWQKSKSDEDRKIYREKNNDAKRQVALARTNQCKEWLAKRKGEQMKSLYRIAKQTKRAKKDIVGASCIKNDNGDMLLGQDEIKLQWKEYFNRLLNETNPINVDFDASPVEGPIQDIRENELTEALKAMKDGKAAGPSGLTSDIIKASGNAGIQALLKICREIWKNCSMPTEWNSSKTVPVYKGKGDPLNCSSYRGIRLLEHCLKIVEKIIERRLTSCITIGNYQFGFMAGKSTIDAIYIIRQLQEKYLAKHQRLSHVFVDLEKAFDRVPREAISWSLRRQNVPEYLVRLVMATYRNTKTLINTTAGNTDTFDIGVGVHQGSILSPLLFITVMEEITKSIRTDDIWNLMYADDIVLTATSEQSAARMFEEWNARLADHGFKVNIGKTKTMNTGEPIEPTTTGRWPCSVCKAGVGSNSIICQQCQQWCHKRCSKTTGPLSKVTNFICPTCINPRQQVRRNSTIGAINVETVTSFQYLGDVLDCTGTAGAAVRARICAAWNKWRLLASILMRRDIPLLLRSRLYGSVIRPVLLYGAETWPMTIKLEQQLHRTDMKMLRWMQRISLKDHIQSTEILRRAGLCAIKDACRQHRLRWFGHVKRSENSAILSIADLEVPGTRPKGRPKKTWMQTIQQDLKALNLNELDTTDRLIWRRKLATTKQRPTPEPGKRTINEDR